MWWITDPPLLVGDTHMWLITDPLPALCILSVGFFFDSFTSVNDVRDGSGVRNGVTLWSVFASTCSDFCVMVREEVGLTL